MVLASLNTVPSLKLQVSLLAGSQRKGFLLIQNTVQFPVDEVVIAADCSAFQYF